MIFAQENMVCGLLGLFHLIIYIHPKIMYVIESSNCNCCKATWIALFRWRGPPSNNISPDAEVVLADIVPTAGNNLTVGVEFGNDLPARNNIPPGAEAEVELVDIMSTQNPVLEQVTQVPNAPQWPQANQANIHQECTGQEHISVSSSYEGEIPVALPLSDDERERVETELEGDGTNSMEAPRSWQIGVVQHVLQRGVVVASPERDDKANAISERSHLLQKMSNIGLIYNDHRVKVGTKASNRSQEVTNS